MGDALDYNTSIRNVWTAKEVEAMLLIFVEKNINYLFDGKRYRNTEIYGLVYTQMVEQGFTKKNCTQIRNKWKALKTSYYHCKKNNSVEECDYFSLLDEILGPTSSNAGKTAKRRRLHSGNDSDSSAASSNQLEKLIKIFEKRETERFALNIPQPEEQLDEVDHMLKTAAIHLRKMSPNLRMQTLQEIVQMTFSRANKEINKS